MQDRKTTDKCVRLCNMCCFNNSYTHMHRWSVIGIVIFDFRLQSQSKSNDLWKSNITRLDTSVWLLCGQVRRACRHAVCGSRLPAAGTRPQRVQTQDETSAPAGHYSSMHRAQTLLVRWWCSAWLQCRLHYFDAVKGHSHYGRITPVYGQQCLVRP